MAVGFPAKTTYANGDVFSASDINDTNGTLNLAAGAQWAAGKNKIINGDFRFNQRAFTSTTTDGTYGFDRWVLASAGGCTYSAQTFTPGTAPVAGYEAINYARLLTTGQSGVGAYSFLIQAIEDVRTLAGQTATISFWAKAASGTPKIAVEINQVFGSGGSPSTAVATYVNQVTLSTSWARYSVTGTVPSISGKTIGTTANTSYLGIDLWVSAGTNFNSRTGSLGIQSNTFDIWGVQIEQGSTATAFQTATGTIQGELAACQRYYYRLANAGTSGGYGIGYAYATTSVANQLRNPVTMRITPTVLEYATVELTIVGVANYTITGLAIDAGTSGPDYVTLLATGASGLTTYRPYSLKNASSSSGYIGLGAEL